MYKLHISEVEAADQGKGGLVMRLNQAAISKHFSVWQPAMRFGTFNRNSLKFE